MKKWEEEIKKAWDRKFKLNLKDANKCCKCQDGIYVEFTFAIQEGGVMLDHWEIEVNYTNDFEVSYVQPKSGNVTLDYHDFNPVRKSYDYDKTQRGAIHEFGHMLGHKDDYNGASGIANKKDLPSVMNVGEDIRARHYENFQTWINEECECKKND